LLKNDLSNHINASQTIKQIFLPDKINFGKRLFYIDDVTSYYHVFYDDGVFIDENMSRIVYNIIPYLKLTMFRLLLCPI